MNKYQYYQDEKMTVWQRHEFTVKANSKEEADNFIRENGLANSTSWHDDDMEGRVELTQSSTLFETQDTLTVEQNDGIPTIEILAADKKPVADNCGNRVYHSSCEIWRDVAMKLMQERFPEVPIDQITAFVDEYWDNLSSEKHNLFNFEKCLHGGNPLHESDNPQLWAYLFHMDVLPRDASDAQIVAFHEKDDNCERDYPIEAITPAEFACRINDDMFNEQEYYVRFIEI